MQHPYSRISSQWKHTEPQNVSFPNCFGLTTILNFWSTVQLFCWIRILPHKWCNYFKGFPHTFHQSQLSHYLLWRMYLNKLSKNPPSENTSLQLIKKFPTSHVTRNVTGTSMDLMLSQLNPVATFIPYIFKIHFNIILTPMPTSFNWNLH